MATQTLATAGTPQAEGIKGGGAVMQPRVRADRQEQNRVGTAQQELELLRDAVTAKDAKLLPREGGGEPAFSLP